MKTCTKCGEEKALNEFAYRWKNKNQRHVSCKQCRGIAHLAYNQTTRGRALKLHRNTKCRAKKKGLCFGLSEDWIEVRLMAGYCEITGIEFNFVAGHPFAPSIDRIKPELGYTEENCRVICWMLNAAMNNWGLGPVLKVARVLVEEYG